MAVDDASVPVDLDLPPAQTMRPLSLPGVIPLPCSNGADDCLLLYNIIHPGGHQREHPCQTLSGETESEYH